MPSYEKHNKPKTSGTYSRAFIITTWSLIGLLLAVAIGLAVLAYLQYEQMNELTRQQQALQTANAETQDELANANGTIASLRETLEETETELEETIERYENEQDRNEDFEDQIGDLTGTVDRLNRLSRTDEELLKKYSRTYFLNENYVPSDLAQIDNEYLFQEERDAYFHQDALPFLEDMLEDARDDGIELLVASAYRSFDEQNAVNNQFVQTFGSGANTFSASQGYSEHQLGTAVDFTTTQVGGLTSSFANTDAYAWLQRNAHEYGFTLSYPEGNQYYIFEPWHWRFVGIALAEDLDDANATLYDWEQRRIDEYLIDIFAD